MPTKEFAYPVCDSIYINGCEAKGIEEFSIEGDDLDSKEIFDKCATVKSYDNSTLTFTCRFNRIIFYKLIGIWDYALKYCPNRRVRHLMEYSKNSKVKLKNFYRALRLIAELICEGE